LLLITMGKAILITGVTGTQGRVHRSYRRSSALFFDFVDVYLLIIDIKDEPEIPGIFLS
jgi:hypothetical protein